jgi:hypothetical protein
MDSPKEFVGIVGKETDEYQGVVNYAPKAKNCIRCDYPSEGILAFAGVLFPLCNACLFLIKTEIEVYLDR